jgi:hypothetical protein
MRSWTGDLYAVLKNGAFIGALQESNEHRALGEVLLNDEKDLPAVIKKWFLLHPDVASTQLTVWPFEHERIRLLENIAEDMSIGICQMVNILHFKNVLRALLTLNARCRTLENGSVSMRIDDETLRLTVQDGVVSVEDTQDAPDITMDKMSAQRLFFLPTRFLLPGPQALKNWLPLPWVMPSPDHF